MGRVNKDKTDLEMGGLHSSFQQFAIFPAVPKYGYCVCCMTLVSRGNVSDDVWWSIGVPQSGS